MFAGALTSRLATLQVEGQQARASQAETDIDAAHENYEKALVQQQQAEAELAAARDAAQNAGWWEKTFGKIADVAALVETVANLTAAVDPTGISRGVALAATGVECGAKVGKSVASMAGAADEYDAAKAQIKSREAVNSQQQSDMNSSKAIDELQVAEQHGSQMMRVVRQMSAREHEFNNEMMMRVRG